MVVISVPSAWTASMVQLLTDSPFTWIVQAPHEEVSQPMLVPVSPSASRMWWTSRVLGSTSEVRVSPLTDMDTSTTVSSPLDSGNPESVICPTPPPVEHADFEEIVRRQRPGSVPHDQVDDDGGNHPTHGGDESLCECAAGNAHQVEDVVIIIDGHLGFGS